MVKETEMAEVGSSTKRSPNLCCPNGIRGENDINFYFHPFFGASIKINFSEAPQIRVKIKIMSFFISINYFRMPYSS